MVIQLTCYKRIIQIYTNEMKLLLKYIKTATFYFPNYEKLKIEGQNRRAEKFLGVFQIYTFEQKLLFSNPLSHTPTHFKYVLFNGGKSDFSSPPGSPPSLYTKLSLELRP